MYIQHTVTFAPMELARYGHVTHVYLQHHMDSAIGVHMIDRWTYYALEFLEKVTPSSQSTLADFVSTFM